MAGAKKYDREDLLDRAIELFRRQGYAGTSTAELVEALGVNRKSMYAEFGSKQELFEAALERYSDVNLTRVLAPIEHPDASADAIRTAFDSYASASEGAFNGLGCLMANSAVERAALDPGCARYVDDYLKRLNVGFTNALSNADAMGDLRDGVKIDETAAMLAMSVVGVSALIRAKAPSDQVHAACRAATKMVLN
ncbi:TetR/AcrR family transcriptional regulator [Alisedimentitalea sp. MJ-SS2]|uniref:TetR/AcrR family transcriptional regulator n=1 Tax=Aliisedimentitalea sp. MJ-SS2 TaxID=3049795 RepID=UPI00290B3BA2|nr:TetR/AcrR family transcriptional regulator [Alisedimentitalea sp. MJ-SS2]MDU8927180.1 TetR/AcrR family transcriptional regulator [Alisedimentitalea sp. MJ-SS2]